MKPHRGGHAEVRAWRVRRVRGRLGARQVQQGELTRGIAPRLRRPALRACRERRAGCAPVSRRARVGRIGRLAILRRAKQRVPAKGYTRADKIDHSSGNINDGGHINDLATPGAWDRAGEALGSAQGKAGREARAKRRLRNRAGGSGSGSGSGPGSARRERERAGRSNTQNRENKNTLLRKRAKENKDNRRRVLSDTEPSLSVLVPPPAAPTPEPAERERERVHNKQHNGACGEPLP
jgi:hypothetical protein